MMTYKQLKRISPLLLSFAFVFLPLILFNPHWGESASLRTTVDGKYTRTEKKDKEEESLDNEYNPKLLLQYSHPLTNWTDLSAEGKFDYKKEDRRPEEDTETREPQIEVRLKSLIYDFKTGFKEVWNRDQAEDRAFGYLLVQPLKLPELRLNYDHDEKQNQYKKDKFTIDTSYKPINPLRIKINYKHEYTNYQPDVQAAKKSDIELSNLSGEMRFDHTLSSRRPMKVEISYKVESLYEEQKDATIVNQDEFLQTLRGKVSYKPTIKTDMSLEYENKTKDDKKGIDDNNDYDLQFNLSQKMNEWMTVSGRARRESKEEVIETQGAEVTPRDTKKTDFQGQVKASPIDLFQFTFKAENERITQPDPNNIPENKDRTILEGSLRSDFPNFLRSYQTLDYKTVHENKEESPYSEDERFSWRWVLKPLENLVVKPEYAHSITKNTNDNKRDTTDEYEITVDYDINFNEYLTVNLSHKSNRKRIKGIESPGSPSSSRREINDDSELDFEFQPYSTIFVTSQITRKDDRIGGERPSEEMSYSVKFDWAFTPFTWSTSYKYIDKKQDNDTETFESKLIYDISDYTIEGEYKFTQTFYSSQKDREDVVALRLKAVF